MRALKVLAGCVMAIFGSMITILAIIAVFMRVTNAVSATAGPSFDYLCWMVKNPYFPTACFAYLTTFLFYKSIKLKFTQNAKIGGLLRVIFFLAEYASYLGALIFVTTTIIWPLLSLSFDVITCPALWVMLGVLLCISLIMNLFGIGDGSQ